MFLFSVKNDSDEDFFHSVSLFAERTGGTRNHEYIQLPAHRERLVEIPFYNAVDELGRSDVRDFFRFGQELLSPLSDGILLQQLGIEEIREIQLSIADEKELLSMPLKTPWILPPPAAEGQFGALREQRILVDDDVTLGVSYILTGDNGILTFVSMHNNTDHILNICPYNVYAGDIALVANDLSSKFYRVLPDTTLISRFSSTLSEGVFPSELSEEIRLSLSCDDKHYEDIVLELDYPIVSGFLFLVGNIHLGSEIS